MGVEKECELRGSASREGESRDGVLVEQECEERRSAGREGV